MRDLYEVLGVDRGANASDLKKAYYRLAKQYHPDHNPNDKVAEDKFKEASSAYQVLSDDDQRARYDRFGFDGIRGNGSGGGGFSNVDDIFSAFGDLFGDFFGGRASGGRRPRGADLRVDLELTFPEAVWGVSKEVKVTRDVAIEYLAELRAANLESLILGCTHYPLLAPLIAELMGPVVTLIDSGAEAARATAALLAERGQLAPDPGSRGAQHHFFLSDEPRRRSFSQVAQSFLGRPLPHVTVVDQTDLPWFERSQVLLHPPQES